MSTFIGFQSLQKQSPINYMKPNLASSVYKTSVASSGKSIPLVKFNQFYASNKNYRFIFEPINNRHISIHLSSTGEPLKPWLKYSLKSCWD